MGDLAELRKSNCFTANKFNVEVDPMAPLCQYKDVKKKTKMDRWKEWKATEEERRRRIEEYNKRKQEEEDRERVVTVAKRALVSTAISAVFHLAVPLAILIYRYPGTSGSVVVKRNLAKTSIVWIKMFEKNIASLLTPLSNLKPLMNYVKEFCNSHCAKTTEVEAFQYHDSSLSSHENN